MTLQCVILNLVYFDTNLNMGRQVTNTFTNQHIHLLYNLRRYPQIFCSGKYEIGVHMLSLQVSLIIAMDCCSECLTL